MHSLHPPSHSNINNLLTIPIIPKPILFSMRTIKLTYPEFASLEAAALATLEVGVEVLVVAVVALLAALVVEMLLEARFLFTVLVFEALQTNVNNCGINIFQKTSRKKAQS